VSSSQTPLFQVKQVTQAKVSSLEKVVWYSHEKVVCTLTTASLESVVCTSVTASLESVVCTGSV